MFFHRHEGHHALYLDAILSYWEENRELYILTTMTFINMHKAIIDKYNIKKNINFIVVTDLEEKIILNSSLIVSAFFQWKTLAKYVNLYQIDKVFIEYFDHFQVPLALGSYLDNHVSITGILFRPTIHYKKFGHRERLFSLHGIKRIVKRYLLLGMLKNQAINSIFCLDPFAVEFINGIIENGEVIFLPEPLPNFKGLNDQRLDFWDELNVDSERKILLVFGSLSKRKGIFELLKSLKLLSPEIAQDLSILFVGKFTDNIYNKFSSELDKCINNSQVQVIVHNEFINDMEVYYLFNKADAVWAAYRKTHVGSSGVLIWAAEVGKPVIATRYGMIGRIVKSFGLGVAIDPNDPVKIANGIEDVINKKNSINLRGAKEYSKMHSREKFAQTIINELTP